MYKSISSRQSSQQHAREKARLEDASSSFGHRGEKKTISKTALLKQERCSWQQQLNNSKPIHKSGQQVDRPVDRRMSFGRRTVTSWGH